LHQGKTTFHISVMSHNAGVKLCNLYQFAEALNGIGSYKIFCPSLMFHHVTTNCICWMLFLHELKQVWYWSNSLVSLIEMFLKQILFTWFNIFSFSCLQQTNLVQALKFGK